MQEERDACSLIGAAHTAVGLLGEKKEKKKSGEIKGGALEF